MVIMEQENKQYRVERDTLGEVKVPAEHLWKAQTQRSWQNFPIGRKTHGMPGGIIQALGYLKDACAYANRQLVPERMSEVKYQAIHDACQPIIEGELSREFPLVVFQTGSGTQTNMNVNEVISGFAQNRLTPPVVLHPNDDVNMSQSSNDTYPSAMHIAAVMALEHQVIPAVDEIVKVLCQLEAENAAVVKIGRTHLQDAVPLTFAQEISGWRSSMEGDRQALADAVDVLRPLAIGGTAVGTGLNAPAGFGEAVCQRLSETTGTRFTSAENKFHALTSLNEFQIASAAVKATAADMMKMANDIRWLASGPRCGLGELEIPANEPGSSIMPGKVNPTQCEQVTQVAAAIFGYDATIGFAATQGNFQLNVFLPVTAYSFLTSASILSESIKSFTKRCLVGLKPNREHMEELLENSLMLTTIFAPYIGYEKAAKLAQYAHKHQMSLREANQALGYLDQERFDQLFHPERYV